MRRRTGATIADLQAGRVTMAIAAMATFLPLARDGKLRALAVASERRSASLPDLPTIAESGYPGFDTSSWQAVFVPIKTPPALVRTLHQNIAMAVALPEIRGAIRPARNGARR